VPEDIESRCESVVLQEGDVLYHPAGVWHKVETMECDVNSLSINFSLFPATWAELTLDTLKQMMLAKPHWRERICVSDVEDAQEQLRCRLASLPGEIGQLHPNDVLPKAVVEAFEEGCRNEVQPVILGAKGAVVVRNHHFAPDTSLALPPTVMRSVLAVLSKTEDFFAPDVTVDGDEDDDEPEVLECPLHHCRFDLHANFAQDEGLPGSPPSTHVVFFVHVDFAPTFERLALLPAARSKSTNAMAENVPKPLLRLLLDLGFLSPKE
jgi:hypothetical protein